MDQAAIESQLKYEVHTAVEMAQILDSEAFKKVVKGLEDDLISSWRQCPDPAAPNAILMGHKLQALDSLLNSMRTIVNTGKIAARQLESTRGKEKH